MTPARRYLDRTMRGINSKRIQCDEIWAFVGAKQKNLPKGEKWQGRGDVWTWTAIDADTRLLVSFLIGRRNRAAALDFMADLQLRVKGRFQLSTDGRAVYLEAVERIFGLDVDYAMLVKIYGSGEVNDAASRYSPPVCIGRRRSSSGATQTLTISRPPTSSGRTLPHGWECGALPG